MSKKEELINFIDDTIEICDEVILIIVNDEMQLPETIKFNWIDAEYKKDYIEQTYDEDLIHNHARHIKIVSWK